MTQLLLQDALLNCCVSKMERYCLKDNIPLKILLFVDSAPGHPPFIGNLHLQIEVVFLPSNIIFLIQPMGERIIAPFMAYHPKRTFAKDIALT